MEIPPSGAAGDLGGATLTRFLTYHPFMAFFCWLANQQFPSSHRPETWASRLRENSPRLYWVCVTLDIILTLLVSLILIGAGALIVYKSVWLPLDGTSSAFA